MKNMLFTIGMLIIAVSAISAKTFTIDARVPPKQIMAGHLKMGHPGPEGQEILVNNQYLTLSGKPVIPVMGEIHYSRCPREHWEDLILKMKANGINIIACYVFWIHHEEIEGQFDWSGNKDLRDFIKLCKKHDLYAWPRIGPWCHGEVRNGGIPDWIFKKKNLQNRTNHPVYQFYADRWYSQIAQQLHGYLHKDDGPVIGIQLENEYWRGEQGEEYIRWLKQTALKYGLDVPIYTVTGWRAASVPKDEVIPLWGSYPAEPWAAHTDKIEENSSFTFSLPMNDETIGNREAERFGGYQVDYTRYPYLTCELGVGNQLSGHRRPVLSRFDGLAIATVNVGSGSNLPGYYVFTGGINPVGIYTTLEENRDETGYSNDYPDISYDFQAAIRETGELAPSYHEVKKLHYFLNEFGDELAPMLPVIPTNGDARKELQYAVRALGNSAYLFGLNYYRGAQKPVQKNVQFEIQLPGENLAFPSKPVDIPDSCIFIWPINKNMDGTLLKYATAQPLCRIDQGDRTDWFFIQNPGITPEFCFDASTISEIQSTSGTVEHKGDRYIVSNVIPGCKNAISVTNSSGIVQRIVILSYEESNQVWLLKHDLEKVLLLSNSNLYLDQGRLHVYGLLSSISLTILSEKTSLSASAAAKIGPYRIYEFGLPKKEVSLKFEKRPLFAEAKVLKTSVDKITDQNRLFHKFFIKEFGLGNPSPIKSAMLFLMTDQSSKLRINSRWLNQTVIAGKINQLDVTGYVSQGENVMLVNFPFDQKDAGFAAKLEIDYFNSDQIEIYTDQSWLTTEQYIIPAPWSDIRRLDGPVILERNSTADISSPKTEWLVTIPDNPLKGLKNLYLHINYVGDKGRCRLGHRLISDNFNNGTPWLIELGRLGSQVEGRQLEVELFPLKPDYQIYFEKKPVRDEIGRTLIKGIDVVPEYAIDIMLE